MDKKPKRRLMGVEPERLKQILKPGEKGTDPAGSGETAGVWNGLKPMIEKGHAFAGNGQIL